ncbi:MAG: nitric-oxide reductase, partial [Planctomycetes bacterium]|nr:nitric-oxide reductase [Planctomycetota bacterium]
MSIDAPTRNPAPAGNSIGFARVLVQKRFWPLHFAIVAAISIIGVAYLGFETYRGAPPLGDFVTPEGKTVVTLAQINRGKELFHLRGLMSYGSFWGDGAERGPDFTADALHRTATSMTAFYEAERAKRGSLTQEDKDAIAARVKREVRHNGWSEKDERITITEAQALGYKELIAHYTRMFNDPTYGEAFHPTGYISKP